MNDNKWLRLLVYVTGLGDQKMLLQNEYLAAGNGILKARLPRLRLCAGERQTLAEIGNRLGSKALFSECTHLCDGHHGVCVPPAQ
jgi:hypothetical protein